MLVLQQNMQNYASTFYWKFDRITSNIMQQTGEWQTHNLYTCQLFLRYKHEIFILGVLGFLKTTRSFPKIPKEVRRLPKSAEGEVIESQS